MPKLKPEFLRNAISSYREQLDREANRQANLGASTLPPASLASADPKRKRPLLAEREVGTVKFFVPSRGFGIISPDAGDAQIYLPEESLPPGLCVTKGDRISFVRAPSRNRPEGWMANLVAPYAES